MGWGDIQGVVVRLGFNLAAPTPAYLLCHMVEVANFIPNHFGKSSIIAFWRLERRRTGQRTFAATWLKRLSRFCWCSTIFVMLFNHISLSYVLSIDIADIVHFCTSRIMDYLSTRPAKLLTAFSLFSRWSNFRNWYFMSILKCWLSTLMSYLPELRPWMPSSRGSRLPRMWTQPCFCWWVWWQFFCCRFSFLLIFYHDFLQNAQTFWAAPFIGLPRSSCADFFKFASKVYSSISSSFLSIHFSFSGSCAFVYLYICTGSSVGKLTKSTSLSTI